MKSASVPRTRLSIKTRTAGEVYGFSSAHYRASEVTADAKVRNRIKKLQEDGYGHYPVCVAKTQLRGAPENHMINVRKVRLAAGAQFVVMVCCDIMTMPGLPKVPSANKINLVNGKVVGLF